MTCRGLRWLLALLPLMLIFGRPAAALADEARPACHAFLAAGQSAASLIAQPAAWTCSGGVNRMATSRAVLRFDLAGSAPDAPPRYFATRASDFGRIVISAIDADGVVRSEVHGGGSLRIGDGVTRMFTPLPATGAQTRWILVEIDEPHFAGIIAEARLERDMPAGKADALDIFIAVLCGVLLAPILFDLVYYRVLRERFLLWHALTGLLMLGHTAVTGGVLSRFVTLSASQFVPLANWTFALAIASASMFFTDFIEGDGLTGRERWLLRRLAVYCIAIGLFEQLSPLSPNAMQPAFYAMWVPVIAIFVTLMLRTLRRGSRAARFVVFGWTPLILTCLYRVIGNLGLAQSAAEAFGSFYLSVTLEVLITALGVADRFMTVKHERDRARSEARVLGEITEVDALTGLNNRRAIDGRFPEMFARGFTTMALLDIDHFKSVNDTHGHEVGDRVLKAIADALAPDEDTLALRLGGEEFMLLLRGAGTVQRAEARRRAITLRAATMVPGLAAPVTASMGLIEIDAGGLARADFTALYRHCDRLLYEAKETGRNRAFSEKLRSFATPPRRQAAG